MCHICVCNKKKGTLLYILIYDSYINMYLAHLYIYLYMYRFSSLLTAHHEQFLNIYIVVFQPTIQNFTQSSVRGR